MALGHGSKIATRGLAFAFDRDNRSASWTGRKNLVKDTSGNAVWSLATLTGSGITRTAVIPNERYTITCTTSGSFRWYVPPANLRDGSSYTLSMLFKYNNAGNTDFRFTDFCDYAPDKQTITPVGKGIYKLVATGARPTYDTTYRFWDFVLDSGTVIEVWDIQLEEGTKASKYESKHITAVGEQFRDWSGNVVPDSGTISYDANGGARFDGASDQVSLGVLESVQVGSRTNEAWVKAYQLSNWHGIFSCGTDFQNGFGLQMGPTQGIAAQGSGNYLRTSWTPVTNRWYHIVATHDHVTNENRLYVDGKLEADATYNINYQVGVHQRIGVFYSAQNSLNFIGEMSQLRLYDRALSQSEVESNFLATAPKHRPGLTPDNPAINATHILEAWPEAPNQVYYIDGGAGVVPVYCDMRKGGWMMVSSNNASSTTIPSGTGRNNALYQLDRNGQAEHLGLPSPNSDYIIGSNINVLDYSEVRVVAFGRGSTNGTVLYEQFKDFIEVTWSLSSTGSNRLTEKVPRSSVTISGDIPSLSPLANYFLLDGVKNDISFNANSNQSTVGGVGVVSSSGDPSNGCYLGHGTTEGPFEGWYNSSNTPSNSQGYTTWVR